MKKILSLLLALALLCSLSVTAFAEENPGGTQTLTLDKEAPASPTWELIIPANVTVSGPGDTNIGYAEIKNVEANGRTGSIEAIVTAMTPFTSGSNTIPFTLYRLRDNQKEEITIGNDSVVSGYELSGYGRALDIVMTIDQADYIVAPN